MNQQKKSLRKTIIILFGLFNIICTIAYFYMISLPSNGKGIHFCIATKSVFKESIINGIGIIAIMGWCMFLFYIIQILWAKKKRRDHRPFRI